MWRKLGKIKEKKKRKEDTLALLGTNHRKTGKGRIDKIKKWVGGKMEGEKRRKKGMGDIQINMKSSSTGGGSVLCSKPSVGE